MDKPVTFREFPFAGADPRFSGTCTDPTSPGEVQALDGLGQMGRITFAPESVPQEGLLPSFVTLSPADPYFAPAWELTPYDAEFTGGTSRYAAVQDEA